MKEIAQKLAIRIRRKVNKMRIRRKKIEDESFGFISVNFSSFEDLDLNSLGNVHYTIDGYIMMMYPFLDKKKLEACLEFLDSNDESNLIIGMNMLYNIKIKSIK